MKIRIYQIDLERDENNLSFRNLEFVYKMAGGRIPEEIYELIYEGEVNAQNLNDVFYIFNEMLPENYRSRSMSVSDVFEIVHSKDKSSFYFVDSVGFTAVPFDRTKVKELRQ